MANNKDKIESFHEIPSSKYWWLPGDVAVPKDLFKVWTPICFFAGVTLTLLTEHTLFWQYLGNGLYNVLLVRGWFITVPVSIGATVALYFWHQKRKKKRLQEANERARMRRYQDAVINQNIKR